MRQRSLAVFLSLIMVMSLVPVSALAADMRRTTRSIIKGRMWKRQEPSGKDPGGSTFFCGRQYLGTGSSLGGGGTGYTQIESRCRQRFDW